MRKILLVLLVLSSCLLKAQSEDTVLNSVLKEYFYCCSQFDVAKQMDLIYPRVFEIVPKKELVKAMEDFYKSPDLVMSVDSIAITKVDKISKFENGFFTRFNHFSSIKLKVADMDKSDTEMVTAVMDMLAELFGEKNVQYNKSTGYFTISQHSESLAINDNYTQSKWRLVAIEDKKMLSKIIPLAVKKKYQF
jgi:hypothetical protein